MSLFLKHFHPCLILLSLLKGTDLLSVSTTILEKKDTDEELVITPDVIVSKEDDLAVERSTGPVIQTFLQISEGKNAGQASLGKEFELLRESNEFQGTQNNLLSSMRDENQAIQKEEDPQEKYSSECGLEEGSQYMGAWLGHSSVYRVMNKLKGTRVGPTSQWCHYFAWALCLILSISCLVLAAVLGMR